MISSKYVDTVLGIAPNAEGEKYREAIAKRSFYHAFHYDSFRNLYYRIALPKSRYINPDNTKTQYHERDFTIMVIDSAFNLLEEKYFKGTEYAFHNIIIVKEGLLINKLPEVRMPEAAYRNTSFELFKLDI